MQTDLEKRIDRVESRFDILGLISDYCKSCDDRDVPLLRSLFRETSWVRSADGRMRGEGLDGIMLMYRKRFEVLGLSVHWTHDTVIRFDDSNPDRATGEVFCHAEAVRNGQVLVGSLRYEDEYRRENGVWYFASRLLKFLYYVPVQNYPDALISGLRQRGYETPQKGDYPETLESWTGWRQHYDGTTPNA